MSRDYEFLKNGMFVESIHTEDTHLSLLASYKGTEVIHHTLKSGVPWTIYVDEYWDELEFIYILSGEFQCKVGQETHYLKKGDSFSVHPVKINVVFWAKTDVEFLYITSGNVYGEYSDITKRLFKLVSDVEQMDGSTLEHCHRIRNISRVLGEYLDLSSDRLTQLVYGAFFHDLGKLKTPHHIFTKPGRLTSEEYEVMKEHTIGGRDILLDTHIPYLRSASVILEQHHERYDGSGYPYGLKGDDIDFLASIVAVVDSYDAMIYKRVYKDAKSKDIAIEEIKQNRGILYHPTVVDAFLSLVHTFE